MKITFIIGGARSGKSAFALREASGIDGRKVYIATAEALDDEMRERVAKHKSERGPDWDTLEEPMNIAGTISGSLNKYNAVLLDCLTLWLSNVMLRAQGKEHRAKGEEHSEEDNSVRELIELLKKAKDPSLVTCHSSLFIVSNEVGMGIVPENKLARQFRDLAGKVNQRVAELADEVYLVTAGIPVKIKGQT